jgi:hypothetical protein
MKRRDNFGVLDLDGSINIISILQHFNFYVYGEIAEEFIRCSKLQHFSVRTAGQHCSDSLVPSSFCVPP